MKLNPTEWIRNGVALVGASATKEWEELLDLPGFREVVEQREDPLPEKVQRQLENWENFQQGFEAFT